MDLISAQGLLRDSENCEHDPSMVVCLMWVGKAHPFTNPSEACSRGSQHHHFLPKPPQHSLLNRRFENAPMAV
jgi:hypothetical protein